MSTVQIPNSGGQTRMTMPKNTAVKNADTPEALVRLEEFWVYEQQLAALRIPFDLGTRDVLLGLANRWAEQRLAWARSRFENGAPRDASDLEVLDRRLAEIAELIGSDVVQHVVDHANTQFGSELVGDLTRFWGAFRHGSKTERELLTMVLKMQWDVHHHEAARKKGRSKREETAEEDVNDCPF